MSRRVGARLVMTAVGVCLLSLYGGAALALYWALAAVVRGPTGLPVVVATVVGTSLRIALLSYRHWTRRLLADLEAMELPPSRAPELFRRLDRLCAAMDLRRPRLLVTRMAEPNAFAVGSRPGTVVLDRRLFALLEADELEALLAHELAHLERRDALVGTLVYGTLRSLVSAALVVLYPPVLLATGLGRAVGWFRGRPADWVETLPGRVRRGVDRTVAAALSAVTLVVLAHSRRREFAADRRAAEVTGRPLALARALAKIHRAGRAPWDLRSLLQTTGHDDRLLSTHPPIEERIDRLQERARRDRTFETDPLRIPVD